MKKVLLIAALAVSSVSFAQINFGAQIGGNIANMKFSPTDVSPTSKFGITIGAVAEIPVSGSLVFRPELNLVQKGCKFSTSISSGSSSFSSSEKISMTYIEIPFNFVYNISAGGGNVFLGAGPSLGLGMGGKYTLTQTETINGISTSETFSSSIKFDGNNTNDVNYHAKAIDFGFGLLGGYKMSNNLSFSLGYSIGLSNISVSNDGSTIKNNGFAIKVGYMFGGGK